jgi:hypothetical protein
MFNNIGVRLLATDAVLQYFPLRCRPYGRCEVTAHWEMRENVLKQYPGLGMEFTLNDRINTYFPAQTQTK